MLSLIFGLSMLSMSADMAAIQLTCMEDAYVTAAEVAIEDGVAVAAVLTKPIYLKSEGDALLERLKQEIEKGYPKYKVVVTRDCALYSKLKAAKARGDEEAVSALIARAKNGEKY